MERFSDLMVKDVRTGECFRADQLLVDNMEKITSDPKAAPDRVKEARDVTTQVECYSKSELAALFVKYNIKAPLTGNDLSPPLEFNLMFATAIGPGGNIPGCVSSYNYNYNYNIVIQGVCGLFD